MNGETWPLDFLLSQCLVTLIKIQKIKGTYWPDIGEENTARALRVTLINSLIEETIKYKEEKKQGLNGLLNMNLCVSTRSAQQVENSFIRLIRLM